MPKSEAVSRLLIARSQPHLSTTEGDTVSAPPSAGFADLSWATAATPTVQAMGWRQKIRLLLLGVDSVIIWVAVTATFFLLLEPGSRLQGAAQVPYEYLAPLVMILWVAMLGAADARSHRVVGSGLTEYQRVMSASVWTFGVLAIVSYILQASFSRTLFIATLPVGIVLLLLGRWVTRMFLNRLRARGRASTSTLVIGTEPHVANLLNDLARRTDVGYQATGVCIVGDESTDSDAFDLLPRHGVHSLVSSGPGDRYGAVIVTDGLDRQQIRDLAWRMENKPVELMFLPRLVDVAGPRMTVREVEGLSLLHVDLPQFTGAKLVIKRAFDILFSAVALVLLSPVLAAIALFIKLDDGGPVLFRQERIGRRGQRFTVHKFRTMCVDAEQKIDALIAASGGRALLFKLEDDPRITKLGQLLRKYSLDELPQFWSVLCGGMSVVGPRPKVAREVAEYTDTHHRRLLIKPGITGLWQVNGRSELSLEESIRLDLRYVENWSLVGDVVIILKTVGVVMRPKGAY